MGFISKDNSLVAEVDGLMKNTIKARKISIDKIMHSLYFTNFHTYNKFWKLWVYDYKKHDTVLSSYYNEYMKNHQNLSK